MTARQKHFTNQEPLDPSVDVSVQHILKFDNLRTLRLKKVKCLVRLDSPLSTADRIGLIRKLPSFRKEQKEEEMVRQVAF